ncbi:MAG: NAD(P)/FAD-dependent oxidoreductase [Flavobacteriales bacterium]|nr:NAD(P)/FAD-dependent oxidoreductase [Flavobacteriales bacterium]
MSEKYYSKFDPNYDFSEVDNIVIGSGLGGLTTAVFLAKTGRKVVVLEQHYVPGGFSHTFKRKDGFVWDVGIHYVGNMGDDSMFLRVSDYLTGGRLKWSDMGEVYDQLQINGEKYDFVAGEENFRKQMHDYFPEHKQEIDEYLRLVKKASKKSMLFFAQKAMPPFLRFLLGGFFRRSFRKYSRKTTEEVMCSITDNRDLRNVLCGQCGDYGLAPGKSSFGAHAIIVNHFLNGGYYPEGGAKEIYENMLQEIVEHGGKIFVRAEVDEILVEKKRTVGVRIGEKVIPCKNVISNVGVRGTFEKLIKKEHVPEDQFDYKKIQPSHSHYCLYLGLNKSDEQLQLPKYNVWYYDGEDMDAVLEKILSREEKELRFAYISFPSAKDPDWVEKHGETSTIQAVGISNMEWFKEFEDTKWMKRGDAYEAIKQDFEDRMLEVLYRIFPQLEGNVAVTEVSTPLSTKHFTNHSSGEIYGLAHTPERFDLNCLDPKTKIKGLYLCGQDIVTVGFGGAVASGLLCATHLLQYGMYKEFKSMSRPKEKKG